MRRNLLLASLLFALLVACSTSPAPTVPSPAAPTTIDSFGANPNPAPANVPVVFSWSVAGEGLTCQVDVDNNGTVEYTLPNCTSSSRASHVYNKQGSFTAQLTVTGSDGVALRKTTPVVLEVENQAPAVNSLTVRQGSKENSLIFAWTVSDSGGDALRCRLDADGNGTWEMDQLCGQPVSQVGATATSSNQIEISLAIGNYLSIFEVYDAYSVTTTVTKARSPYNRNPVITTFTATAAANFKGTVNFTVSDPDRDAMTCLLRVPGVGQFVYPRCSTIKRTFTFPGSGEHKLTLEVVDAFEGTASKVIGLSFVVVPIVYKSTFVGDNYTCAIDSIGRSYCWGLNASGQLGNPYLAGIGLPNPSPLLVSGDLVFTQISQGEPDARGNTCGLTALGVAYCWGWNEYGQGGHSVDLGSSSSSNFTPTLVNGGLTFKQLVAGVVHTCGLTTDGAAYCWGENKYGQLGNDTNLDTYSANSSPLLVLGGHTFTQLAAGGMHTCGLKSSGEVYCWGLNGVGQLGNDSNSGMYVGNTTPLLVNGSHSFVQLAAGNAHTCGLKSSGEAYCWGFNYKGQLGNNTNSGVVTYNTTPLAVQGSLSFSSLDGGESHTCGITTAGKAYCWGQNNSGQLGNPNITTSDNPVPTAVGGGYTFGQISLGGQNTCGITTGQQLYCWGEHYYGQLGVPPSNSSPNPTPVLVPAPK